MDSIWVKWFLIDMIASFIHSDPKAKVNWAFCTSFMPCTKGDPHFLNQFIFEKLHFWWQTHFFSLVFTGFPWKIHTEVYLLLLLFLSMEPLIFQTFKHSLLLVYIAWLTWVCICKAEAQIPAMACCYWGLVSTMLLEVYQWIVFSDNGMTHIGVYWCWR